MMMALIIVYFFLSFVSSLPHLSFDGKRMLIGVGDIITINTLDGLNGGSKDFSS